MACSNCYHCRELDEMKAALRSAGTNAAPPSPAARVVVDPDHHVFVADSPPSPVMPSPAARACNCDVMDMAHESTCATRETTTLGAELRKHERYLSREINYDERHADAVISSTHDQPKSGIAAIFGTWPGDETDEEIDEALYGDKRRAEEERKAVERVIEVARAMVYEKNGSQLALHLDDLVPAIAALDAARSKEGK